MSELESKDFSRQMAIIIPMYNEERNIARLLNILIPQLESGKHSLIVVDDGSSDSSFSIVSEYKTIKCLTQKNGGPGKARNYGVRKSHGEYLLFLDADMMPRENFLAECESVLLNNQVENLGGIGISLVSPEPKSNFETSIRRFFEFTSILTSLNQTSNELVQVEHNPSGAVIYSREAFLSVNGYDESLRVQEDVDLDFRLTRAGFKHYFNPKLQVVHGRVPDSFKAFVSKIFSYGRGAGELFARRGFFRKLQYVPFVTLLITLFILVLSLIVHPQYLIFSFAIYIIFLALVGWRYKVNSLLFVILFHLNIFCYSLGFYLGIIHIMKIQNTKRST